VKPSVRFFSIQADNRGAERAYFWMVTYPSLQGILEAKGNVPKGLSARIFHYHPRANLRLPPHTLRVLVAMTKFFGGWIGDFNPPLPAFHQYSKPYSFLATKPVS